MMLVDGYTGVQKTKYNTSSWAQEMVDIKGYRFRILYYPAGTGREGCVILLQATDEELGSSDSRDCAREDYSEMYGKRI